MFSKFKRFLAFPFSKKKLLFEGVIYSFIFKILIKTIPFKWTKSLFRLKEIETNKLNEVNSLVTEPAVKYIGHIINSVQRHVPWHNTCLVEALTGKFLLKKQGVETIIVMGVRKDETGELKAHAWLLCLEKPTQSQWGILTGFEEKKDHTPVGYIV